MPFDGNRLQCFENGCLSHPDWCVHRIHAVDGEGKSALRVWNHPLFQLMGMVGRGITPFHAGAIKWAADEKNRKGDFVHGASRALSAKTSRDLRLNTRKRSLAHSS